MQRRAFTLLEMLIVIAVMVTLMSIAFKLSSISDRNGAREATIMKLQRLENCLSGYYAAFGSYPPVKLYGSRDIYLHVENNVQTDQRDTSRINWACVEAACRSQPVESRMPFPERKRRMIEEYAAAIREAAAKGAYAGHPLEQVLLHGFSIGYPEWFAGLWGETDWRSVQLFKFGLTSYLLPRYLVMMGSASKYYADGGACAQWADNNDAPHDALSGGVMRWSDVIDNVDPEEEDVGRKARVDYARVANMPTQAVTARWMPNLEEQVYAYFKLELYGITLCSRGKSFSTDFTENDAPKAPELFTPTGNIDQYYMLDEITLKDGWNNELYYYSPAGFQSYVLWSCGPDGKTFPPWVSRDSISNADDRKTAAKWIADDIIKMKY